MVFRVLQSSCGRSFLAELGDWWYCDFFTEFTAFTAFRVLVFGPFLAELGDGLYCDLFTEFTAFWRKPVNTVGENL